MKTVIFYYFRKHLNIYCIELIVYLIFLISQFSTCVGDRVIILGLDLVYALRPVFGWKRIESEAHVNVDPRFFYKIPEVVNLKP